MPEVSNENDVQKYLALAGQIQMAAPFVSDAIVSFLDGMKGKIDMPKLVAKLKEVVGPEMAPVRDLIREIVEEAALAKGKLVQKLMESGLSEHAALTITLADSSFETTLRNMLLKK